jgi:chromate transporter
LTIALTLGMTLLSGLTRINPLYGIAVGALLALASGSFGAFP